MKVIRILKCSDSRMWYAGMVGQDVPLLCEYETEFLSRTPSGYSNIVLKHDAILVNKKEEEGT